MSNVAYISEFTSEQQSYAEPSQLKTYYDARNRIIWLLMKAAPRPAFTLKLLNEITTQIKTVKKEMAESGGENSTWAVILICSASTSVTATGTVCSAMPGLVSISCIKTWSILAKI
jgi:hypothetical protein